MRNLLHICAKWRQPLATLRLFMLHKVHWNSWKQTLTSQIKFAVKLISPSMLASLIGLLASARLLRSIKGSNSSIKNSKTLKHRSNKILSVWLAPTACCRTMSASALWSTIKRRSATWRVARRWCKKSVTSTSSKLVTTSRNSSTSKRSTLRTTSRLPKMLVTQPRFEVGDHESRAQSWTRKEH